jgi:hypothetical protein
MVLEQEDGEVLVDGPTDIDPIGVGDDTSGEVLALVLGAPTISVVGPASVSTSYVPITNFYLNRMAAPKKYHSTAKSLMMWANSELEHVGRIAAVEDPDLQYSYAISTLNGMAHLKDALYEFVTERQGEPMTKDLKLIHDKVIRVMKHLIKEYKLNIQEIVQFNTRKVLSSLNYLKNAPKTNNKTRKQNKKN